MLRGELIKAQEYVKKAETAKEDEARAERSLQLEVLARVLKSELPLLISADRVQDILTALRLARGVQVPARTGRGGRGLPGAG